MIAAGVSVAALLDAVGPGVLTALATPMGLAHTIGPPVIAEGPDPHGVLGGTVLLLGTPGMRELQLAAGAGAAAIIVRAEGTHTQTLVRIAEGLGVSLLAAGPQVTWGELFSMVRTLFTVYEPGEPSTVDLFALADRVAREAGGAVAIEDMAMRVVAYSSVDGQDIDDLRLAGILGRRVPEHAVQAEEYLSVLRADGAIWCLEPREYAPRLAIGVQAYEQAYGTIWVVQGEQPLTPEAPRVLAEAAAIAVPELAKMTLAADSVRRLRNDRVARLVHGVGPVAPLAAELGLAGCSGFRVVAFGVTGGSADDLEMSGASDLVRNALASYRVCAAVAQVAGQGIAIVAGESQGTLVDVLLGEALERASLRNGASWRAGVSRVVGRLGEIPEAAAQARAAFAVLAAAGERLSRVAHHADLSAELFLHQLGGCSRIDHLREADPIATVLAHDREHDTDYVRSLSAWTATNYDVPAAAERLFLHANTLRHRLGRIRALIDLDDPDLRLVLTVQLRLRERAGWASDSETDPWA